MNKKDIRKRMVDARESLPGSVNARQFALKANGVDVSQYAKYEKGGPLGMDKIAELCSAWGINQDWVSTGKGSIFAQAASQNEYPKEKPGSVDYQAKYFEAMDKITGYNEWLQRMMESNFGKLLEAQGGHSALLGILLRRDVYREAGGNPEIAQQKLQEILQKIGPKLNSDLKEGIGADGHNQDMKSS